MGTLSKVLIFAAGAAIGSVVTWRILSVKCEERIHEEAESIRESLEKYYRDVQSDGVFGYTEKSEDEQSAIPVKPDVYNYRTVIKENNYKTNEKEDDNMNEPYEIPYEDFGERDGYDVNTLTYYSDGVLADEDDNPIEDVLGMVGCDLAVSFRDKDSDPNDTDRDSIYVRNDEMECDFEILRDYRSFSSVTGYRSPVDDE